MIKKFHNNLSLFSSLSGMLNQSPPLYELADKIDWVKFDTAFASLYCQNNGRPAKPIRLMCGLLILKHLRNLSDKSVVEQWSENVYYQYFYGMQEFISSAPCASSELVHFRNRIGEKGIELTIGHLKSAHRLGRNFYKGLAGDAINILLAVVTDNFKRAMKALWALIKIISESRLLNRILLKESS